MECNLWALLDLQFLLEEQWLGKAFAQINLVHTSFTYLLTACDQSHLNHLPVGLLQCNSHEAALKVIADAQSISSSGTNSFLVCPHYTIAMRAALAPSFFPGTIHGTAYHLQRPAQHIARLSMGLLFSEDIYPFHCIGWRRPSPFSGTQETVMKCSWFYPAHGGTGSAGRGMLCACSEVSCTSKASEHPPICEPIAKVSRFHPCQETYLLHSRLCGTCIALRSGSLPPSLNLTRNPLRASF